MTQFWAIGLTQNAAHQYAVAALLPIVIGFPHTNVFDEGIRYLLLNRETIVGVFTSNSFGGTIAFQAFGNLTTAEGLSQGQSPKRSVKWPTSDGKAFRGGASGSGTGGGTKSITLQAYLSLLLSSWQAGRPPVPQRWIEWLTRLIDLYAKGKYTPTQIYAFLAAIDFAANPPKLL